MQRVRLFLTIVVIAAVGFAGLLLSAPRRPPHPYLESMQGQVQVMAHQGGDRLWPSNTLYAFNRAAELGVDVLELDIHVSSDGELVVIHDDSVDRTTNGTGLVNEQSITELQILDAGYHWSPERAGERFPYRNRGVKIPTLAEVFEAFPNYKINIEIKPLGPSIAQPLCDLIYLHGKENEVMIVSFHGAAVKDFRQRCPAVATAATPNEIRAFYILNRLYLSAFARPAYEAMQVPEVQGDLRIVTERFVRVTHRKNVQIHVWTVNEVANMERLIALGVDGIITDRPDRLMRVLGRRDGMTLPEGVPE